MGIGVTSSAYENVQRDQRELELNSVIFIVRPPAWAWPPRHLGAERSAVRIDSGNDRYSFLLVVAFVRRVLVAPISPCDGDSGGRKRQPMHTLESCRNGRDNARIEID